jgi:hypothetical protein
VVDPTAPRDLLASKGRKLRDPLKVASDPWMYRRYIQQSKDEFTVAKHGYVVSRSDWFSERRAGEIAVNYFDERAMSTNS